jgi:hypothetical protein
MVIAGKVKFNSGYTVPPPITIPDFNDTGWGETPYTSPLGSSIAILVYFIIKPPAWCVATIGRIVPAHSEKSGDPNAKGC